MAMPDTTRSNDDRDSDYLDGGPERDSEQDSLIGQDADPLARDREELELDDEDVRLPWLEGDEEEDEERSGAGQIMALAVMAVVALSLIIGGIWWFTRDKRDGTLVADGGVIQAPAAPYKEKPKDPGGMTFQGTGDSSFAVSEGESRSARLGEATTAAKPGFDAVGAGEKAAAAPAEKAPAPAKTEDAADKAPATGPSVQVGAYSSREAADAGWSRLSSQHSVLSGMRHRIAEGSAEFGKVYRLQVVTGDLSAARKLCGSLKSAGQDCTVKN